jgi:hypothetical protein
MFSLKRKAMICVLTGVMLAAVGGCMPDWVTIVAPTPTAIPSIEVAFVSAHDRYVTAEGEDEHFLLRQEPELGECGWFTQQGLHNGKITLKTCYDRYVTAPIMANAPLVGADDQDWRIWQQDELGDCGQFTLHDFGNAVALETCAQRYLTAGDYGWPDELQWAVIGRRDDVLSWEQFTVLHLVANFDNCDNKTHRGGEMGEAHEPSSADKLMYSFVQEGGRGCVVRLEYDIVKWSAFWIKLQGADLSPYSQLVFDIKADPQENVPKEIKIELKRAGNSEMAFQYISGITTDWQTQSVMLEDFVLGDSGRPLPLIDMEELVFVFEVDEAGKAGIVYLDNIALQ